MSDYALARCRGTHTTEVKRGCRQLVHNADNAARGGEHAEERVVTLLEDFGESFVQLDDGADESRGVRLSGQPESAAREPPAQHRGRT